MAVTLIDLIDELVAQHGSLRALARVAEIDAGYLSRLRRGEKMNPEKEKLKRLGLRRIVAFERLNGPSAADRLAALEAENAALKREAHTWSKAAETYAASEAKLADALTELVALEDMRLRLRELHEMGRGTDYYDYHRRLPLAWDAARAALGPN